MDKIKTYFVEVILKNVGPKVAASVMTMLITFLAAHQDLMEKLGVTYYPDFTGIFSGKAPSGRLIIIEFDTLQVWGGLALVAGATALWSIFQHHGVATVTGAPQSGDKRVESQVAIEGGRRADDPPQGAI